MSAALKLHPYPAYLIKRLQDGLANLVAAENATIGFQADGHAAELFIQRLIVKVLIPHVPGPDHIRENEPKIVTPTAGECIPDITITKVGGGLWGIFELKTLLVDDKLNVKNVTDDLNKLCEYKKLHNDVACLFILVGSNNKLFNSQRARYWKTCPIKYDGDIFDTIHPSPQCIGNEYVAVPCGHSKHHSVSVFIWEIMPEKEPNPLLSPVFSFEARMTGKT